MKTHKKYVSIIIGVVFIILILSLVECIKNDIINVGMLIATVALAVIAYVQLEALREQENAKFIFEFNRDFFNNKINQEIIKSIEENGNVFKENKGKYDAYQIDDYLGYFELMAIYHRDHLLSFHFIDEMFGHYISLAWKNTEIKNYIIDFRNKTGDPRYYKPFEDLAVRVIKNENKIRNN